MSEWKSAILRTRLFSCVAVFGLNVAAVAGDISTESPLLFRASHDPQVLVFGVGNDAQPALVTSAPLNRANLTYNQDIYPSADRIDLWSPEYDFSPFAEDAESTEPVGYWPRLRYAMYNAVFLGRGLDCRVTTAMLELAAREPDGLANYAATFTRVMDDLKPLVSIDAPADSALPARDAFRAAWPELVIGLVVREERDLERAGNFDFVVAYENALPPQWRGQTAVGYLHSKVGEKPVILATHRPEFLKELFWLATGAAGLQHDDLPPVGTEENETAAINLRAISAFIMNIAGRPSLATELHQPGILAALEGNRRTLILLPRAGVEVEFRLPGSYLEKPEFIGGWYNPVTDQTITLPRIGRPADATIRLKRPNHDPWIYWHVPLPESEDRDSTTTLIVPEPPDPFEFDTEIDSEPSTTPATISTNSIGTENSQRP